MAVRAYVYDIVADSVHRTQERVMEAIGIAADRADAEFIPNVNPVNICAVHIPALVNTGKNGYGDVRRIPQMTEYFPMVVVRVPSAVCHLSPCIFPVRVSVNEFPESTGYLQVLVPSRWTTISISPVPGIS